MHIRLHLVSPDLERSLLALDERQLRRVAIAVASLAAERVALDRSAMVPLLDAARTEGWGSQEYLNPAQRLVQQLDQVGWDVQNAIENGMAIYEDYSQAFSRARAAHAVASALEGNAQDAAFGATYEALFATDDLEALREVIRTATSA